MNIFDSIIILFILMFGVTGFKHGVIKEGVFTLGTIIVYVLSFLFKGIVGNTLCRILPFFNFAGNIKGLVTLNIIIYQLIGFISLFSLLMLIFHIVMFFTKILQKVVDFTIILTLPSKLGGAIIGLLKGYVIAFVVLLVLMLPLKDNFLYSQSKLASFIVNKTPIISNSTKDITSSIIDLKDLVVKINKGTIGVNDANLQLLDSMLKYGVVDSNTVDRLVELKKLESVKNIDSVLNNYR